MNAERVGGIDSSRQMRLLVVDDMAVHRVLLVSGLGSINPFLTVDEARSSSEAMEKLDGAVHYDAVICDWLMPDGSGEELLRWMRARPHFSRVPFIMVSSNAQEVIEAFSDLDADDYVVKPFMPLDVYRKVVDTIDKMAEKNPS
ncbi:MAG TPA: response regulator [Gallionella sp.]|nr:response regulator [Gallionella sp.]